MLCRWLDIVSEPKAVKVAESSKHRLTMAKIVASSF